MPANGANLAGVQRLSLALFLPVVLIPIAAWACDCRGGGPACSYVSRAAAVFVGKVVFDNHDDSIGLNQRTLIRFEVEETFKGLSPGTSEVWADPGSFTSCYAEYAVGMRYLVFAYSGSVMPPDTSMISVGRGRVDSKPIPPGFDPLKPPVVYSVPECSGTREMSEADHGLPSDLEYLRQYRAGTATPGVRGRVTEDRDFGIFDPPGLAGVAIELFGSGFRKMARTDADGYYQFDSLLAGKYVVKSSLPQYRAQDSGSIDVARVGCAAVNFDMIAPGVIEGKLLDRAGKAAPGIEVEVLRLGKDGTPIYYAEKDAMTGPDGRYRFDHLPSGNFEVGVNVFNAPDPKTPYMQTKWSERGRTSIHLVAGQRVQIAPFRLPAQSAVRIVEAQVRWPDGRPASGVNVWADVGDSTAAGGETDATGRARFEVLQGIDYTVEAKIWVEANGRKEVARSGKVQFTPTSQPVRLDFVLNNRTKNYN